jgi:hypothetical protein
MTSRASVLALGLSALACRMDNPAFDGGDELADAGEGSDDLVDSGDLEESGTNTGTTSSTDDAMDDVDSSTDAIDDTSSTTDPACTPGTTCGTCHVCDEVGDCVPDVGATCDENVLQCGDYLYGKEESTCYRLAETVLLGSCSEGGECVPPQVDICPFVKGEVHFACDPVCVTNQEGCEHGAFAANVDVSSMCAVQGETNGCHPVCLESAIQIYGCVTGLCESLGQDFCEPYACDPIFTECFVSCELPSDCAEGYTCQDFDCVGP